MHSDRSQGIELTSFRLNTHRIHRDLNVLRTDPQFNGATFLHPVSRTEDVYTLHTYFSRVRRRCSATTDNRALIRIRPHIAAAPRVDQGAQRPAGRARRPHLERHAAECGAGAALAARRAGAGAAGDAARPAAVADAERDARADAGPRAQRGRPGRHRCGRSAGECDRSKRCDRQAF